MPRTVDIAAFRALVGDEITALSEIAVAGNHIGGQQLGRAEFVCVCLVVRSISNANAAVMLMSEGFDMEAGILLRSCIENLMLLAALQKDPEDVLADMVEKWRTDSKSLGETALQNPALQEEQFRATMREALANIRDEQTGRKHKLSPYHLAPRGDLGGLYLGYLDLSIDVAHPTTHALNRHVAEPQLQFRLDSSAKPDDPSRFYSFLSLTLVALIETACSMLPVSYDQTRLQSFTTRHMAAQGD